VLDKTVTNDKQIQIVPYVFNFFSVNLMYWIISAQDWWRLLRVPSMKPDFADLRAYTAPVTCSQLGIDYLETNCDPWGRKIGLLEVYVPMLQFLNLNESRTFIIGQTFQILLFISIYVIAYKLKLDLRKPKNASLMIITLLSPPVALLIERGNFEIILFVFFTIAIFLVQANRKISAYFILGFLSILKLYPVFFLMVLLANRRIRNTKFQLFFGLFIFGLSTITMSYLLWGKLDDLLANSVSNTFWRTFGVTVIPRIGIKALDEIDVFYFDLNLNSSQYRLIGFLIFAMLILVFSYLRSKGKTFGPNLSFLIEENSFRSILVIFSVCMVFLSYFLISSFDYRMVYLIPLFLIGISQGMGEKKSAIRTYFAYGVPIVMWCQLSIWSTVLTQIPIIFSMAILMINMASTLISDYLGSRWVNKFAKMIN
jgi:hypothetical protein